MLQATSLLSTHCVNCIKYIAEVVFGVSYAAHITMIVAFLIMCRMYQTRKTKFLFSASSKIWKDVIEKTRLKDMVRIGLFYLTLFKELSTMVIFNKLAHSSTSIPVL